MARFGITGKNVLGGPGIPTLRKMAKDIKKSDTDHHHIAQELWSSQIHEARILAGFVDEPSQVTEKQMEAWVKSFDSWDLCDQVVSALFDKTIFAYEKAFQWSRADQEFVKRAGFVMMAALAVHDKKAKDEKFLKFLPVIKREAGDERNFVKKAVNWALRQIGKRNPRIKKEAIKAAKEIVKLNSRSAKWIAKDAIKELSRK
jgi:3-methyladenine DNA glycosylase AlkD